MSAEAICHSCANNIADRQTITCMGFCQSIFHVECARTTLAFRDMIVKSPQVFWMCSACTRMMANATFRQTINSTNYVLCQAQEEQNKVLLELRTEIQQNTANINKLLETAQGGNSRKRPRELDFQNSMQAFVPTPANISESHGTKETEPDIPVPLAAPTAPRFWLYLSGFDPKASVEQIEQLTRHNLNINAEETIDVAKLVPKNTDLNELSFVSFKVGIGLQLKEVALANTSWQRGIIFREFDFGSQKQRGTFLPEAIRTAK